MFDTIVMDTYHYRFVQTHTLYNTQSESSGTLQTLSGDDVSMQDHQL